MLSLSTGAKLALLCFALLIATALDLLKLTLDKNVPANSNIKFRASASPIETIKRQ